MKEGREGREGRDETNQENHENHENQENTEQNQSGLSIHEYHQSRPQRPEHRMSLNQSPLKKSQLQANIKIRKIDFRSHNKMNSSYRIGHENQIKKTENKFQLSIHKQFRSEYRTLTVREFYEERLEQIDSLVLKEKVYVFYSAFRPNSRQPALFFPNIYKQREDIHHLDTVLLEIPRIAIKNNDYQFKYRTNTDNPFKVLLNCFKVYDFQENESTYDFHIYWGSLSAEKIEKLKPNQKIPVFPGCWQLGRKDNLTKNLMRLKKKFGSEFKFMPQTYLLDYDLQYFRNILEQSNKAYILKPVASACGRGIKLVSKKDLNKSKLLNEKYSHYQHYLASEYIKNPHLINGLKYDLRIYVLVSSFEPLVLYVHQKGMVRFATRKYHYDKKGLKHKFMHLTNYSINKKSSQFVKNQGTQDESASKWEFVMLRNKFEELGLDWDSLLRGGIYDLIIKTCISVEPYMLQSVNRVKEHRKHCFELFGFDVLIDDNLQPWLIEVNVSPSLSISSSNIDKQIKQAVISDTINLVGLKVKLNRDKEDKKKKKEVRSRAEEKVIWDRKLLLEFEEEQIRKEGFNLIFPHKENYQRYSQFFNYPRTYNKLLWDYLANKQIQAI